MSRPGTLCVPSSFLRLRERFGDVAFSPSDVAPLLGGGPPLYVELSRLVRSGWLFRLFRGRFATVDPLVRVTPGIEAGLRPFRSSCFYPLLYRGIGDVLRRYSGRLDSIALFGSCARGSVDPDSDVDLLILVRGSLPSVFDRAREELRSPHSYRPLLTEEAEHNGHRHPVHQFAVTAAAFRRPGVVMLDVPDEARILYDPERRMARSLRTLTSTIRRHRARRVSSLGRESSWELGSILEAPT